MKKFALVVLIIGFSCCLAASINDNSNPSALNTQLDCEGLPNNITGNDDMISLAAKDLLACTVAAVEKHHSNTLMFIEKIQQCGSEDDVGTVAPALKNLFPYIGDVVDLDEKLNSIISNTDAIPPKFFIELYKKNCYLISPVAELYSATELVFARALCVTQAIKDLQTVLLEFPITMKNCLIA